VTFRRLASEEVVRWAAEARLAGIEWGGDIHVPPGDLAAARRAADLTRAAGLEVASYGSYYRLGQEPPDLFARVLETAIALGAPIIRVWAGRLGSDNADAAFRAAVADDGRRIADMAAAKGLRIATEWHGNTLTDTAASASALFNAVGHPAFRTYWQPRSNLPPEECLRDLHAALPRLAGLHVFHWSPEGRLGGNGILRRRPVGATCSPTSSSLSATTRARCSAMPRLCAGGSVQYNPALTVQHPQMAQPIPGKGGRA
jgi:sugar phosphate isomerase/epimerase